MVLNYMPSLSKYDEQTFISMLIRNWYDPFYKQMLGG